MLNLTAECDHIIDEKGRLFVSNKLRSKIDVEKYGADFILTLGVNGILCLYPEKCFRQLIRAGASEISAPDEAIAFERLSFALASSVEFDRQGRLLISEKLRKRANLGNQITLVGTRDHIEIWNTADWERYLSENIPAYQRQIAQARKKLIQSQDQEVEIINHSQEE